jgi:hypothetical protein
VGWKWNRRRKKKGGLKIIGRKKENRKGNGKK